MERLLDKVKLNLTGEIEKYFRNVEVESIEKSKDNKTLNFSLISTDVIPYVVIKNACKTIAEQLLNTKFDDESKNPIILNISYKLSEKYTPKLIFEEIKKDFYEELKEYDRVLAVYFHMAKFAFNDDIMSITLDQDKFFHDDEVRLVEYIKDIYKKRFNIDLKIDTKFEKLLSDGKPERPKTVKVEETKNEPLVIKSTAEVYGEGKRKTNKKSSMFHIDGDILYGYEKKARKNYIKFSDLDTATGFVTIKGILYHYNHRITKKGSLMISLSIFDDETADIINIFTEPEDTAIFLLRFKLGSILEIDGNLKLSNKTNKIYLSPTCIKQVAEKQVIKGGDAAKDTDYLMFVTDREDNEKEKRVELHLHTKMSANDGIGDIREYMETAVKFGMDAMAITDHGCVNALPEAYEYKTDTKNNGDKFKDFKIINGMEGYLVEDYDSYFYDSDKKESHNNYSLSDSYVVYTVTATGINKKKDSIIAINAKKIVDLNVVDNFSEYVKYDKPLSLEIKDKTKITDNDLTNAKSLVNVLCDFMDFAKDSVLITTDKSSIWEMSSVLKENNLKYNFDSLDIITLARLILTEAKTSNLIPLTKLLKVKVKGVTDRKKAEDRYNVFTPSEVTEIVSQISIALFNKLINEKNIDNIDKLKKEVLVTNDFTSRQKRYHIILLAKNDIGRVNLYKLVSDSHTKYMYKGKPCIPRSLLNEYREGLIVGSACILGEFMDAILHGYDDSELKRIANFYDYLEVQPTMNNSFLLREDSENFKNEADLEKLNIKVIEIADIIGKPVCATCDSHYVKKEDKLYRDILCFGAFNKKGNRDKDGNIKEDVKLDMESSGDELLYFRTTKEMLDEFSYLGVDKAYEIVVKNTRMISDMIENIDPLRHDKCTPEISGSDEELRKACYENLEKMFGKNVHPAIKSRLDKELDYIIENGYSVMYIAAKRLIDFSREKGYPVGSRGSVGSSFAATMAGISEVNPLPPFYLCPKCKHLEYDAEETRKYNNDSGFDMPDKICPECGAKMIKDGINIPFETFLGIPGKANKEPDIDLNFCSAVQSDIHEYTLKLFGEKNTFKAGTVGTVAPTIAFAYIKDYARTHNVFYNYENMNYMKGNILECKRTSGQHPGGMIVVPDGEEIYTFTPIQYPAGKDEKGLTTHFDYHKIDKNLLKLDILGQESPSTLKKLQEFTGIDFNTVPFYEEDVIKLFQDTSSIGVEPAQISGTKLGCLTIPEFGTETAINMVLEAKPKTVADLIRISGLAHGTDVWRNNVEDLIMNNICTLSEAICCRDDIMNYLIDKGMDPSESFKIMELVRKGKKLSSSQEEEMRKLGVPDWYIECCNKIQYMFPKAHAAAYVTAALKIAYFKVHYPVEYYAAYFSVRKDGLEYKLLMQDKDQIHIMLEKIAKRLEEIKNNKSKDVVDDEDEESTGIINIESLSKAKLIDYQGALKTIEEMKARGIDFIPIDIYKAKANDFCVINGKIMPSFDTIPGLVKNAKDCEDEHGVGKKPYTTIDNFVDRTGINKTVLQYMKDCGLLNELKENVETTLFDFL